MDDTKGGGFLPFDRRVLDPVCFKLTVESHVQSDIGLGVGGLPGVWEDSQEAGRRNHPPFLRNQPLPKSVRSALVVLDMSNVVPIDLEDLNARDGWILESRIDLEGGAEVAPLLVELLLAGILCFFRPIGFLCSVEITQESRSGGGRESFHKLFGWGYTADMWARREVSESSKRQ